MILPDVNILVHAFRSDTSDHAFCRTWLDGVVNGDARYGMAPQVLSGVIRVVTHPKVFAVPSNLNEVLRFCDILLTQSHCAVIQPGERHWPLNPVANGSLSIGIMQGSRVSSGACQSNAIPQITVC